VFTAATRRPGLALWLSGRPIVSKSAEIEPFHLIFM
jgi:hypothetical protein